MSARYVRNISELFSVCSRLLSSGWTVDRTYTGKYCMLQIYWCTHKYTKRTHTYATKMVNGAGLNGN